MQRIRIDDTELTVSRVSFGTGSLHHLPRRADRLRVLAAAVDAGITHLDTSPYYGFGLAEADLGHFLPGRRDRISVASKIGLYAPTGSPPHASFVWARKLAGRVAPSLTRARVDWSLKTAEASLSRTLARCRTDFIDVLFLHEPDAALVSSDEMLRWLESRRTDGSVRYFGVAGEAANVAPWLREQRGLGQIIQTRDSLRGCEAEFVLEAGRSLQFTYGYMSAADPKERDAALYAEALRRNATGSILVSTRSAERLEQLAGAAD